jgi:hypothetical protein
MEWRELEEGGAAIILNAPMLQIFSDLADTAEVRVQDMLIYQLGNLLEGFEGFKRTIHTEQ